MGRGDVFGRISDDPDLLAHEAAARARAAALDGDTYQGRAFGGIGAKATEAEAMPQVAPLQLDASALFEIASCEPDRRAAPLEVVERFVDGGLYMISPDRDLRGQMADIGSEDRATLVLSRRTAVVVLEHALENERIGHAIEPKVRERAMQAQLFVAGAFKSPASRAVAADESSVDVEEVENG